jgi:endo-1,4-beta-xylanase
MTPTLRELAQPHGLLIGPAVTSRATNPDRDPIDPRYLRVLGEQFNILTPENAAKFGPLSTGPGTYDWRMLDAMIDFAREHDMAVRAHTGVWHRQVPDWVDQLDREAVRQAMVDHLTSFGQRYHDRIQYWDVVNEAIDTNADDNLRDTVWHRAIDDDYIDLAFRTAAAAAPDVRLVYNDYGTDTVNPKSDAVYELVSGMLDRNVPIHAVGFQMHLLNNERYDPDDLIANWQRFVDLGLEVHITELDIDASRLPGDTHEQRLVEQGRRYQQIVDAAVSSGLVTVIQTWGFTDRYSWVYSFRDSPEADPLLLNREYQPKPAFFGVAEALRQPAVPRAIAAPDIE